MNERRRIVLIAALLVLGLATILWLVSAFGPQLWSEEVQRVLLWFGIAIPAAIALLAGFKDVLELVDRFRSGGEALDPEPGDIVVDTRNQNVRLLVRQYNRVAPERQEAAQLQEHVAAYLRWLLAFAGYIKLTGVRRRGADVIELPLDEVYIPLQASRAADRAGAPRTPLGEPGTRTIALNEILDVGPRIVITGGPGSGKTTVLLHLAYVLAQSLAREAPEIAAEKLGWTGPLPLPLFIPLSRFAAYWRDLDRRTVPEADRRRTLAHYISHYLIERQATFNLPEDFFIQLFAAGHPVLLLLDGLDEVPTETVRTEVRQAIEDLVTGKEQLRVVVTCRTAAYKGRAALGREFQPVQVLPLDQEHVTQLVTNAYARLEAHDETRRADRTRDLLQGIAELEEARRTRLGNAAERLVATPLMVRLFLIVHYGGGTLPEQRAELYGRAIDSLLHPDYGLDEKVADALSRRVGDREFYRDMLKYLAFHMHTRGEEQGREIEEAELRRVLREEPALADLTDRLITDARTRGTVLEERFESYRFVHLALQEYLTAAYLADNLRDEEKIAAFLEEGRLDDSWWREVILLLTSYLQVDSGPLVVGRFLRRLARLDAAAGAVDPAQVLAGAELAATAALDLPQLDDRLRDDLARRLHRLLTDDEAMSQAPATVRVWAGNGLGRLGEREPRLLNVDQMELCYVPAGPFWMGDETPELELDGVLPMEHEIGVEYDYWIGRFPVTNAQFAAFVQDGGYDDPQLWPEARAADVWSDGAVTGWYWDQDEETAKKETKRGPHDYGIPFHLAGHPVVGVSWYEALAFCRWLTRRWRGNGVLPDDWAVTLPNEPEWEKAARGGAQIPAAARIVRAAQGLDPGEVTLTANPLPRRAYPWGETFDGERANTRQAGLGFSSRAGSYPDPGSPYGSQEMGGNVFEWTRSLFGMWDSEAGQYSKAHQYPYVSGDDRERLGADYYHGRVLRGGSWDATQKWSRCGARFRSDPEFRDGSYGFRVVLSPSTSDL